MTAEIDVWRSAKLYVDRYGDDALIQAAMRADALLKKGDLDGYRVWRRIVSAVKELQRRPTPGGPVN
jgi:hypothetical protein